MGMSLNDKIDSLKNSDNSQNDSKIDDLKSQLKDHVAKYHSLSESDRTAQLKDIRSRMVSLAELSGKLGQFIGPEKAVTDAIKNGIDIIINSDNDFKSLKNSSSSTVQPSAAVSAGLINDGELSSKIRHYEKEIASLSAEIEQLKKQKTSVPDDLNKSHESHQSKLDALQRLSKLNESFKSLGSNNNDACESLLNNLCSGLEKFLGYQETSKGYSGTGIVYSDLDRLCDGVMSFLHGVLHNIKPKLGLHKESIKNAIESLKLHKNSGKEGFNEAIGKVVQGVREYNEGVKESNKKVSDVIETFTGQMEKIPAAVENFTNYNHIPQIDEKVYDCLQQAEKYKQGMEDEVNNIGDLQKDLQTKINMKTAIIAYQAAELKKIHSRQKEDLRSFTGVVHKQLNDAKEQINLTTSERIRAFVSEVNRQIGLLKHGIENVNNTLKKYVELLLKWIEKADAALGKSMQKVSEIIKEASGTSEKQHKQNLLKAVNELKEKGLALYKAYELATFKLRPLMENVSTAVKGLDQKVQEDLKTLKKAIDLEIGKYADWAKAEIRQLKEKALDQTSGGGEESIQHNWGYLKRTITSLVGNIYGKAGDSNYKGLQGIVDAVGEYAAEFGNGQLENVVKEWVGKILDKDVVVKYRLGEFVKDNNTYFQKPTYKDKNDPTLLQNPIKDAIKDALTSEIADAVRTFAGSRGEKIDKNLNTVQSVCEKFADALEAKIKDGETKTYSTNPFLSAVVSSIEKELNADASNSSYGNHYLISALRAILPALATSSRQAAAELNKFSSMSKIGKNVTEAMSKVDDIKRQFDGKTEGYGKKIRDALTTLMEPIEELDNTLSSDVIGSYIDNAISPYFKKGNDVRIKMLAYRDHVNDSGPIDNAIKAVSAQALQPITDAVRESKASKGNMTAKHSEAVRHLNSLCNTILTAARDDEDEGLNKKLIQLQQLIDEDECTIKQEQQMGLRKIKDDLNTLRNDYLQPLIQQTQDMADHASEKSEQMIRELSEHVGLKIKTAETAVTQDVQTKYVGFMRSQLNAFVIKISDELGSLTNDIAKDADKDFKGFMQLLRRTLESSPLGSQLDENSALLDTSFKLKHFFSDILDALNNNKDIITKSTKIEQLQKTLDTLFTDLSKYNTKFEKDLTALKSLLNRLRPSSYDEERNPLLHILTKGVQGLHDELDKAYISVYDGDTVEWDYDKNPEKEKCANVILTTISVLFEELYYLFFQCSADWIAHAIQRGQGRANGALRKYLEDQGFETASLITRRNQGGDVKSILTRAFSNYTDFQTSLTGKHIAISAYLDSIKDTQGPLCTLYRHLTIYFNVCHLTLPKSKTYPCTIRDICAWICGLPYTAVYKNVKTYCNDLLNNDESYKTDAVLQPILYADLPYNLRLTAQGAYNVLITISGNGQGADNADYPYACNYCDNSRNFYYPSNAAELLDMLRDVCKRLLSSFYFLYNKCQYTVTQGNGWSDCDYGHQVPGYYWNCDPSSHKSNAQPNTKPKCSPKGQSTCQPKSPLQAHLTDSLPGCLPHKLMSVGCSAKCSTCPTSKPGQQCITPMGFGDLSSSASITGRGKDICKVLYDFCGNAASRYHHYSVAYCR
ncbi:hypothetical protein BOVATA_048610 [Babesia ovata]|uniref:C3H1-type domain-containing protein n=1 Tax=Babesia ovata TaxID=189622 RepID=A0A2H6KK61_9APIC|nr:uncharacterized protein BOVATA_048610 [Babesia ovata]GBE63368.1 hypothetical protein BOVATA_048610 [Babesia ovata]